MDDMIATGSTLRATYDLTTQLGAEVLECGCVLDNSAMKDDVCILYFIFVNIYCDVVCILIYVYTGKNSWNTNF